MGHSENFAAATSNVHSQIIIRGHQFLYGWLKLITLGHQLSCGGLQLISRGHQLSFGPVIVWRPSINNQRPPLLYRGLQLITLVHQWLFGRFQLSNSWPRDDYDLDFGFSRSNFEIAVSHECLIDLKGKGNESASAYFNLWPCPWP